MFDYKTELPPASMFSQNKYINYIYRHTNSKIISKFCFELLNNDKSLIDTKFGNWICRKLDIRIEEHMSGVDYSTGTNNNILSEIKYRFKTKNKLCELIARTMTKIPVFSIAASGMLEANQVVKDVKEGENFFVTMGKSTAKTVISTTITATTGSIGAKYGPMGEVAGTSIGLFVGKKINENIDKIIDGKVNNGSS